MPEFIVSNLDVGKRIDKFICEKAEISRSLCKDCFEKNLITVNNKTVKQSYQVKENDVVLGYAGFWLSYEYATITKVSINPALQNRGLGFYLFNSVMNIARELGATSFSLEVRVSNIPAQKLYLKSGYKESGIRKGYYSDGENAIVMIKEEGDEHYEQVYYGDRK